MNPLFEDSDLSDIELDFEPLSDSSFEEFTDLDSSFDFEPININRTLDDDNLFLKNAKSGAECGICLDLLANGSRVCINKNCQHGFHCHCIVEWIEGKLKPTCPVCRARFDLYSLAPTQKVSFGKSSLKSDISYLKSI